MENKTVLINRNCNAFFVFCYVISGWIVYSPITSWMISNPDGIYLGIIYRDGDGSSAFGRIGVGAVIKLMYSVVSPNLMLIICLIMLGIIICIIADLFGSNSIWAKIIMGALLLLSPSMSSQLTYYYCMVQYVLAFVLSVLACYLVIRIRSPHSVAISAFLIMTQLTLYQAFLSVTVVISLYYILFILLSNENIMKVIITAIKFVSSILAGIVMYVALLNLLHVDLDPTRGFDSMGSGNIIRRVKLVTKAYWYFYDYLFCDSYINNSWMNRKYINLFVLIAFLVIVVYIAIVRKLYNQLLRVLLIMACITILPAGFELMVIAAPKVDPHGTTGIIMIPAMSMFYMSVIWMWSVGTNWNWKMESQKRIKNIVRKYGYTIVLLPILYNFILFTAVFQNVMWLNYQSMYSLCQRICLRIEEVEGYDPEVEIAFVGYPQDGKYPFNREELRDIVRGTLASKGQIWDDGGYLSSCVFQSFYKTYFGIDYDIVDRDKYEAIVKSKRMTEMDDFPGKNSVIRDGNLVIVKVSDVK